MCMLKLRGRIRIAKGQRKAAWSAAENPPSNVGQRRARLGFFLFCPSCFLSEIEILTILWKKNTLSQVVLLTIDDVAGGDEL